jgi:hypothetical protein
MPFIADSLLRSRILQPIPHKVERLSRAFDKASLRHVLVASWVADANSHRIVDDCPL